eukprot:ANDGO_03658.mRNA.1 Adenylate cyclase 2
MSRVAPEKEGVSSSAEHARRGASASDLIEAARYSGYFQARRGYCGGAKDASCTTTTTTDGGNQKLSTPEHLYNPLRYSWWTLRFHWTNLETDFLSFQFARSNSRRKARMFGFIAVWMVFLVALVAYTCIVRLDDEFVNVTVLWIVWAFVSGPLMVLALLFAPRRGRERLSERLSGLFLASVYSASVLGSIGSGTWQLRISYLLVIVAAFVQNSLMQIRFVIYAPLAVVSSLISIFVQIFANHNFSGSEADEDGWWICIMFTMFITSGLSVYSTELVSRKYFLVQSQLVAEVLEHMDEGSDEPGESTNANSNAAPAILFSQSAAFPTVVGSVYSLKKRRTPTTSEEVEKTEDLERKSSLGEMHNSSHFSMHHHSGHGFEDTPSQQALSKASSANSLADVRQSLAMSRALNEITVAMGSIMERQAVLEIIMEKSKQLMRSEASSLMLLDEKAQELVFNVATGSRGSAIKEFRFPVGKGIAGYVAQTGEPLLVPDAYQDPRFNKEADKKSGFVTKSILCVPLKVHGKVLGVVQVINCLRKPCFDDSDLQMLLSLAAHAAISIENARLYEEVRFKATELQSALEKERWLSIQRRKLEQYVPRSVVDSVALEREEVLQSITQTIDCTVLFSDIEGFTRISEHTSPDTLVLGLNRYFSVMVACVEKYEGVVDKFIGDAVMAVWSSIKFPGDHAIRAVACALEMQYAVEFLDQEWVALGIGQLNVRIGINSGPVISGSIGAKTRKDHTVLGDNVNVSSRLESNARPGEVLISEATYQNCESVLAEAERLKPIYVKNRTQPVQSYAVKKHKNLTAVWKHFDIDEEGLMKEILNTRAPEIVRALQNYVFLPPSQPSPPAHSTHPHPAHRKPAGSISLSPAPEPGRQSSNEMIVNRSSIESIASETVIGKERPLFGDDSEFDYTVGALD